MLRYSFMTFACPRYSLEQVITAAVRHGYDGVEPRAAEGHRHGIELELTPAERSTIRRQFDDAGVAVACIATSVSLNHSDQKERRRMADSARAYCELAADLGSQRIRVFGGYDPEQPGIEAASARVGEALDACADTAAKCDVYICLETHDYFSAGAHVAAVCNAVDSPWVRAAWDTQHPITAAEDIDVTASVLMPFVEHVHFHDVDRANGQNEVVPIWEGQAPIAKFLSLFRKHGYDGFVSGEWFYNYGPENDLAHYIRAVKMIEQSL
jgi:sugar phosphate isomerase/epimerase